MTVTTWQVLIDSLWQGEGSKRLLPGVCFIEVLHLMDHDYDDVDRLLIDMETMGA